MAIVWSHGSAGGSLMWAVTCPDTYAPSHLALAGVEAGSVAGVKADSVATEAEYHKRTKYLCAFFETSGPFGPAAAAFFTDLGKWVTDQLEEPRAYSFASVCGLSKFSGVMRQLYWGRCLKICIVLSGICWLVLSLFCCCFLF